MKVRLQDVVEHCINKAYCTNCRYWKSGECIAKIDGFPPFTFEDYFAICKSVPQLAKALYTNEEIELYENNSERTY